MSASGRDMDGPPTRAPLDGRLLFPPTTPPLHITIRFSSALPDLHLDIPSPQQTTVVSLKHLIRGRLAADAESASRTADEGDTASADQQQQSSPATQASRARLRFIHNGRILPDASVLSAVLKAPPPPPLSHHHYDPKGKAPAGVSPHQQQRVFINCSIGDELPAADLLAEEAAAAAPPPSLAPPSSSPSPSLPSGAHSPIPSSAQPVPRLAITTTNLSPNPDDNDDRTLLPTETPPTGASTIAVTASAAPPPPPPPPLGFDRLAQAGLSAAEIATLRSHFRAIHTARFAPDAMPSPDSLRAMEDAWLDNDRTASVNPAGGTTSTSSGFGLGLGGGGGTTVTHDEGEGEEGATLAMDDAFGLSAVAGPLIRGMLVGFVFPLGVIGWLGKEEGVWSRRMHVFVVFGVLLSVSVGAVRGLTGEG